MPLQIYAELHFYALVVQKESNGNGITPRTRTYYNRRGKQNVPGVYGSPAAVFMAQQENHPTATTQASFAAQAHSTVPTGFKVIQQAPSQPVQQVPAPQQRVPPAQPVTPQVHVQVPPIQVQPAPQAQGRPPEARGAVSSRLSNNNHQQMQQQTSTPYRFRATGLSSPVLNPFQEAPGGNSLRRSRRRKIPRRASFAIDGHHVHSVRIYKKYCFINYKLILGS